MRNCQLLSENTRRSLTLEVIACSLSIVVVVIVGVWYSQYAKRGTGGPDQPTTLQEEEGAVLPWGPSRVGHYRYAAVATDSEICTKIGTEVLEKLEGSAVDAAVAAMFCVGVVNMHLAGVGGGHFMTIYDTPTGESKKKLTTYLGRDVAPESARSDMFVNQKNSAKVGGLSVGVPGEVSSLHTAWQNFGRVNWHKLVEPSIHICQEGTTVGRHLAFAISYNEKVLRADKNMANIFVKPDGSLLAEGDVVKLPKLAVTLQRIAEDPTSYYTGSLAKDIIADLAEYGSIMTEDDLANYKTKEKSPLNVTLQNGQYTVFAPRPPSSGAVLLYMLNILDGYNFHSTDADPSNIGRTYQQVVEAFKFGFAKRSALGDEDFVDIIEMLANLTSDDYAEWTRLRINNTHTQDLTYYGTTFEITEDHGTVHLSMLAPDGGAVSMTSSINYLLGGGVYGGRTGILFNNGMDDFSTPGGVNLYDVPASPNNYIEPRKMSMSSMTPVIVLDKHGNVVFVVGAAGGTYIITATALVMINSLWLSKSLQTAIDVARVHHQLLPNTLLAEAHIDQELRAALQRTGHDIDGVTDMMRSSVQAIHNLCRECTESSCLGEPCIHAVCDSRRDGVPHGF